MERRPCPLIERQHSITTAASLPFLLLHTAEVWTRVHLPFKRFCTLTPIGFRADGTETQPGDLIVLARDAEQTDAMPEWRQAIQARASAQPSTGLWSRFFGSKTSESVVLNEALLCEGARLLLWPATREPVTFYSGDCGSVGTLAPHIDLLSLGAPQAVQMVFVPR
jgi:hypothetical protein